jgi:hypothetical protein
VLVGSVVLCASLAIVAVWMVAAAPTKGTDSATVTPLDCHHLAIVPVAGLSCDLFPGVP